MHCKNRPMMKMPSHSNRFLGICFVILLLGGCSRLPEATFSVSEAVTELPELHQQNIEAGMASMFGTPTRPKLLLSVPPTPADDSESDSVRDDVPDDGESDAAVEAEQQVNISDVVTFLNPDRLGHGAQVYQKRCAGCHGESGDGMGEAAPYLRPKPRDYRKGVYKFTSTPYGDRPTRQDLVRTIRRGAKGTSMPAFPWMSKEDLDAVIDYVIYFSLRGTVEEAVAYMADDYDEDEPIDSSEFANALQTQIDRWDVAQRSAVTPVSAKPAYDLASVEEGRRLFIESSCYNCHGEDAQGQTEWLSPLFLKAQEEATGPDKIAINYDAWGDPAPAADITARMLHGGRRPLDIYRRIYTGINGTPMPQFSQLFEKEPDAIWHMVHYVLHIVDGHDPTMGISVADLTAEKAAQAEAVAAAAKAAAAKAEAEAAEAEAAELDTIQTAEPSEGETNEDTSPEDESAQPKATAPERAESDDTETEPIAAEADHE